MTFIGFDVVKLLAGSSIFLIDKDNIDDAFNDWCSGKNQNCRFIVEPRVLDKWIRGFKKKNRLCFYQSEKWKGFLILEYLGHINRYDTSRTIND